MAKRVRPEKSLLYTRPNLVPEWDDERDIGDFETGSHYKAKWKCGTCAHSWKTEIRARAEKNRGCLSCLGQVAHSSGNNSMFVTHPLLAAEFHPTRNHGLDPRKLLAGTNKRLWWKCSSCENEWATKGQHRAEGSNCPFCSMNRLHSDGRNSVASNPRLANEFHISKNEGVDPKLVTVGDSNRYWWICSICNHEWQNSPQNRHRLGQNCGSCAGNKAHSRGINSMSVTHPDMANEFHPTKNGKKNPASIKAGSNNKIWWLCSRCENEWISAPSTRLNHWNSNSRGCGYCSGNFVHSDKRNAMSVTHPELCEELHPTKNGKFSPEHHIAGTNKRLHWVCSDCTYEWATSGASRTFGRGTGCPRCSPRGFRLDMPATYYVIRITNNGDTIYYKGGISGNMDRRMRDHIANFSNHPRSKNWKLELIDRVDFTKGEDAEILERKLLVCPERGPNVHGLSSELFLSNPLVYARENGYLDL